MSAHKTAAAPEEPVAWQWLNTANYRKTLPRDAIPEHWRALYTAPQATPAATVNQELLAALHGLLQGTQEDCGQKNMPSDKSVRAAFAAIARAEAAA